jgi:urease subunit gamma/beta
MRLTRWEEERLLVFQAAELARRHRDRGLLLNAPEAVALVCDAMFEAARAGGSYDDVTAAGLAAVSPADVMPGVRELVDEVNLEVLLGDGTRLVVLVDPLGNGAPADPSGPGGVELGAEPLPDPSAGLERIELEVSNTSRHVVRVSSHFPFEEVNARLAFPRDRARGFRLDLPAGASMRWAPGEVRRVGLVRLARDGAPRRTDAS